MEYKSLVQMRTYEDVECNSSYIIKIAIQKYIRVGFLGIDRELDGSNRELFGSADNDYILQVVDIPRYVIYKVF
jgi:hypothetical protein